VIIWEKLITEVFSNFDSAFSRRIFDGAFERFVFDVMTAQITVFSELRLKLSLWITSTGRDFPGSEPLGAGSLAHHISPFTITTLPERANRNSADLYHLPN
jgi:hypothetical protein